MKRISVIVPVYNTEQYIERCLISILEQSYSNIEIIVVDDGSTDKSNSIIKKIGAVNSKIKLIEQENKGLGGARNTGIKNAKGNFFMFVDSDDYLPNNALELLVGKIGEADFIIGNMSVEDRGILSYDIPINETLQTVKRKNIENLKDYNRTRMIISVCNKLYKKSFFEEYKLKFDEGVYWEDNLFTLMCWSYARAITHTIEPVYVRVRRGNESNKSITQTFNLKSILDDRKSHLKCFDFISRENDYEFAAYLLVWFFSNTFNRLFKVEGLNEEEKRKLLKENLDIIKRERLYLKNEIGSFKVLKNVDYKISIRYLFYKFKGII